MAYLGTHRLPAYYLIPEVRHDDYRYSRVARRVHLAPFGEGRPLRLANRRSSHCAWIRLDEIFRSNRTISRSRSRFTGTVRAANSKSTREKQSWGRERLRRAWTRSVYGIFRNTRGRVFGPDRTYRGTLPRVNGARDVALARVDASIDQCRCGMSPYFSVAVRS